MEAIRINTQLTTDGEIRLTGLPYKKGEQVELILLPLAEANSPRRRTITARQLRQSDLIGLWKDRGDIQDSVIYARQLREQAQHRHG
jgi:hypothetical protein